MPAFQDWLGDPEGGHVARIAAGVLFQKSGDLDHLCPGGGSGIGPPAAQGGAEEQIER